MFVVLVAGQAPQTLLVVVGTVNGLILPLGFGVILFTTAFRKDLLRGYKYPLWLLIAGLLAFLLTIFMGVQSFEGLAELWQTG